MKNSDLPNDVMAEIRRAAKADWGDDPATLKQTIADEVDAYKRLHQHDFDVPAAVKQEIFELAFDLSDSWDERLVLVQEQAEAYCELATLTIAGVPEELITRLQEEARTAHPGDFSEQRNYVVGGAKGHLYKKELDEKIEPIKQLLVDMERIIGNEFYNDRIQNYSSWGVWEGEGRAYRYPVMFMENGEKKKEWSVPTDIAPDVLLSGCYKVGQNELNIFRALVKITELIEKEYGVKFTKKA